MQPHTRPQPQPHFVNGGRLRRGVIATLTAVAVATAPVATTPMAGAQIDPTSGVATDTPPQQAWEARAASASNADDPMSRTPAVSEARARELYRIAEEGSKLQLHNHPESSSPRCQGSLLSESDVARQLRALNAMRAMNSLPEVSALPRDDERWTMVTASAVANAVTSNDRGHLVLSHTPINDGFLCATPAADRGGRHSVLGATGTRGYSTFSPITGLIRDNQQVWNDVGHRAQVLAPAFTRTAIGVGRSGESASYAMQSLPDFDADTPPVREEKDSARYVLWPSPGYFPVQWANMDSWSARLEGHESELAAAQVTIRTPSGETITPQVSRSRYADETIYYPLPRHLTAPGTYTVTITLPSRTVSYETTFFNPNQRPSTGGAGAGNGSGDGSGAGAGNGSGNAAQGSSPSGLLGVVALIAAILGLAQLAGPLLARLDLGQLGQLGR